MDIGNFSFKFLMSIKHPSIIKHNPSGPVHLGTPPTAFCKGGRPLFGRHFHLNSCWAAFAARGLNSRFFVILRGVLAGEARDLVPSASPVDSTSLLLLLAAGEACYFTRDCWRRSSSFFFLTKARIVPTLSWLCDSKSNPNFFAERSCIR